MKKLVLFIFLSLMFLSAHSFSDDIRDFQIEGIGIGDNALDFFSSSDIDNASDESYPDGKFLILTIYKSMGPYEVMQLVVKPNDSNYKIYGITGVIPYRTDINACYKKNNKIVDDLKKNFPNAEMTNHGRLDNPPLSDPYGGTYDLITFDLNNGRIQISCNDWSELSGIIDSVKVEIFSSEFSKYLQKVLY